MHQITPFSEDYASARQRLLRAAKQLDWSIESHSIGVPGPTGEELCLDIVSDPGEKSENGIVLSSGVHGVEGFFGSAVQLAVLEKWKTLSLPKMKYVFIHAMNPYGFAWLRRFDENNVDLNRNFLLPEEQFAHSPKGYAELDTLLNPKRPPSPWEPFLLKALWQIAKYGIPTLQQAIAAGQYEYPKGLFFGGNGPSKVQDLLRDRLGQLLRGTRRVVHFDFHTGLGKMGESKLLIDYLLTESQRKRLIDWFGKDSFATSESTDVAYQARGGFGRWCASQSFAPDYLFACTEFGTYHPVQIIAGLRAENQACHWGTPADRSTIQAKKRLKELFCPSNESWRTQVLQRSIQFVSRAAHGLDNLNQKS